MLESYINKIKDKLNIKSDEKIKLTLLAKGEYNINYEFINPDNNKKLILRLNTKSQLNLENQIEYEYNALKILENSGRTPKVFYVDNSKKDIPYGVLVMEFLEGRSLKYENKEDLEKAAEILYSVHKTKIPKNSGLINVENPLSDILKECASMFLVYENSNIKDLRKEKIIKELLQKGIEKVKAYGKIKFEKTIVNTELNQGNFLINERPKTSYLVDWEKPIISDFMQDLGHFLAPTTTFWKSDYIFSKNEIYDFLNCYLNISKNNKNYMTLKNKLDIYIPVTCLRGITWCSMAYVEYNDENRPIKNEFTRKKIDEYLSYEFLNEIKNRYFN